jgi:hypothetical protein
MSSAGSDLRRALETYRKQQGLGYLQRLAGHAPDRPAQRPWLCSEAAMAVREQALTQGELSPVEDAAVCAHMARAALESRYAGARRALSTLPGRSVSFEGESRRIGDLLRQWSRASAPAQRDVLARSIDAELAAVARLLQAGRAEADGEVGVLLARLLPKRHPDAGPEGGSAPLAERWLTLTQDVTTEALAFARKELGVEGRGGLDNLWSVLGSALTGLFPREGRLRRLAGDWEPLGLRGLLRSHARAALEHPGPFAAAHVVVVAAPRDVRVSPSAFEYGLASELSMAESVGRALGHAHASAALPPALRHASAASLSRAVGQLGLLRFAEPRFLQRNRGLVTREGHTVARLAAAYALVDSRLSAAAVLARTIRDPSELERIGELSSRALQGSLPPGWGALLATRLSPGAPFRAKALAPAIMWALRERYDEDWYLNPRSAEPIAGALARAGEFAVEGWAEELGAAFERGPERLAELF